MCISPLSAGGLNLLLNFQKGGPWQDLNFESGVAGKEGGNFFQGELQFYKKNYLKSEIFNDKKSLWTKIFFSVITKNSDWEILTKNLVTFKREDRVKDENLWYFGRPLKNLTFRGEFTKNWYRKEDCLNSRGLDSLQI